MNYNCLQCRCPVILSVNIRESVCDDRLRFLKIDIGNHDVVRILHLHASNFIGFLVTAHWIVITGECELIACHEVRIDLRLCLRYFIVIVILNACDISLFVVLIEGQVQFRILSVDLARHISGSDYLP